MTMKWSVPHCSPNTTPFSLWLESNMPHRFCILTLESCSLWTFLINNVISNFFLYFVVKIYTLQPEGPYVTGTSGHLSFAFPLHFRLGSLSCPLLLCPQLLLHILFHMDSLPSAVLLLQEMVLLEGLEGSTGPSSHLAHIHPYKTLMHPFLIISVR